MITFFAFILLTAFSENRSTSFYDLIGVKKSASVDQIKKAYRKLSIKHHPDHGGDKDFFIKLSKAYDTLKDEEKRKVYDNYGEKGLEEYEKNNRSKKDNIYSDFSSENDSKRGDDLNVELQLTLEQIFLSDSYEIDARLSAICPKCFGMGADSEDNIHKCQKCKGEGVIPMYLQYGPGFVVKSEQKCDQCDGKGTIIKKKCPICKGRKLVTNKRKISFNVEKGLNDGDTIVLENEADESIAHKSGHLILTVKTIPHKRFVRKGNDLHFDHTVRLSQALLGFDIEIEGLAGEKIRLKREFITRPGLVGKIAGKGMPIKKSNKRGDLYVKYWIDFPEHLTDSQKNAIRKLNI